MDPSPSSPATVSSPTSSSASPGGGGAAKLRLLCSYGGRIVPRPHDKALCYAGGESRLLAVDRRTATASLSALTSHISRTLLNGRPFSLKYQLPDHDLDSLVSVATDEDLVNMIDEYDRSAISSNPTRLRFFIFPAARAESSTADYDPKSEAWFFDALRSAGIAVDGKRSSELESGGEGMVESEGKSGGGVVDSSPAPAPVSSESSGSTRSAPAHLPAIKVCAGEELAGFQAQDFRPTYSLVDSPESDSSATSPNFQSPTLVYLDSLSHSDPKDSKFFTNQLESEIDISPRTDQLSSVQTYGYSLSQAKDQMQLQTQLQPTLQSYQQLQPQYIHAAPQYVAQYYSTALPAASYSTAYQPYLQQQQQQQQAAYQLNKPYPVYLMHVGQAPPQRDLSTAATLPSSHPQLLSNPPMMVEMAPKVYIAGPSVDAANFAAAAAEFDEPLHSQIYKTQPPAIATPRQTAANAATAMLLDNLTQLQLESTK